MVIVAMIATTKNPTKETQSKVTVSMTTVLHRIVEIDWSTLPLTTVQVVRIQRVLRSVRCCCLLLDRVARPCTGLCGELFLQEQPRNSFFHLLFWQIFPCKTACILVHARAFDIARPRGSGQRSFRNLRGIQEISCSFECF